MIQGELNGLLSNFLAKRRQQIIKPYIREKNKVLDLGCGIFRWENYIRDEMSYTGIDIEADIISYNKIHYPDHHFVLKDLDEEILSFPENYFDLIIMLAILEHLKNPVKVLCELKNILTNDGIIIISTPHPRGERILNLGSKIKLFSQDKHQHQPLIDANKMQEIASQSNLKIISIQYFLFGFNQKIILGKCD